MSSTTIIRIAILVPLPYSVSRLLWAAGVPLGIDPDLLATFGSPGWGSLALLVLAALPEVTAWWVQTFVATRRRTVPRGIPLVGGRPVRPSLVVAPLLAPITILAAFNVATLGPIVDGFVIPAGNAGLAGWAYWGQVATFWIWGLTLTFATAEYWLAHARRRPLVAQRPG